jgi:DNA-binding CsgD family transcriptional regulator
LPRIELPILDTLIDYAYRAAFKEDLWPAFLEKFSDALGGRNTALILHSLGSGRNSTLACVRTDPDLLRLYNEHYHAVNPWTGKGCKELPARIVGVGEIYCTERELERTEFYNEWLRPQGLKHSIAGLVTATGEDLVMCSALRTAEKGAFGSQEIAFAEALLPHVGAAIRARERLGDVYQAGRAALDVLYRFAQPCLLVDRNGHLAFMNLAGEHMVAQSESLRLTGSLLTGTNPEATSELHRLIARAAGQSPVAGQMLMTAPSGRRTLVFVDPVAASDFLAAGTQSYAAVWVNDLTTRVLRLRRMQTMFGLTNAEAGLVGELASGNTLAEIADEHGLSRHTVRNQLKSVFAKTGARSQADLVRVVLSCPESLI